MDVPVTRRRALLGAAAGVAALAGCSDPPRRTSTAVFVTNVTDSEFTVTVRLYELPDWAATREGAGTETGEEPTDAGGTPTGTAADTPTATGERPPTDELEEVLVQRETLAPEGSFGVPGEGLPDGDLRVLVTTTDGQSDSHDWARLDERSTLDVRIADSAIRFTELD
ncbi:hypothetical protein [Natronomonas marina]|jgi:hypothetical protein|uniref:hypothetical protein n=1 Tax=Natronomonas marina TaxID=2961939 RepID=UPI0020C9A7C0|nr:hypothetical protein [Natronomonas marina]